MNKDELTTIAANLAGTLATVTYTEGKDTTPVSVTYVIVGKVTTKGLAVKMAADEPTTYIAPTRIVSVAAPVAADNDGLSTREVAEIFDMSAKELRIITRSMGLGVGKGRRYTFGSADVDAIRTHLTAKA